MQQRSHQAHTATMSGRTKAVLAGFVAIALFFLLTEHRAHLLGALPYLLVLACPLMHLFHRHGNHGHGAPRPDQNQSRTDQRPSMPGESHEPQ